jgi:putative transcriptional regulator
MGKTYQNAALAAVHEVALGLAEAGTMGKSRLRGFDALCLTPVEPFSPTEIRALRLIVVVHIAPWQHTFWTIDRDHH